MSNHEFKLQIRALHHTRKTFEEKEIQKPVVFLCRQNDHGSFRVFCEGMEQMD